MSDAGSKIGSVVWTVILLGGAVSYCSEHLSSKTSGRTAVVAPPTVAYRVVSPGLNCRNAANAHASIREELHHDTEVAVMDTAGGWARIQRDAGECWANLAFLRQAGDTGVDATAGSVVAGPDEIGTADGSAQTFKVARIPISGNGGTFSTAVSINNTITLQFLVDSGASDVTIPADVFSTLERAGAVSREDVTGRQSYTTADGSSHEEPTFVIRTLRIGDIEVHNIAASVAPAGAPLLLGQSFLTRFKHWTVDNTNQQIVLEW